MTADRLPQTIFIDKKPGSSVRYSVDLSDFFAISNRYKFKEALKIDCEEKQMVVGQETSSFDLSCRCRRLE